MYILKCMKSNLSIFCFADLCLVLVRYKKKKERGKGISLNTLQWVVNKRLSRINKLIKLMSVDEREKKYQPEASRK